MDFAAFIKSIERRLIGYLRFATLNAAKAEVLFDQTCTDLRQRWASIPDDEREAAAFEAASATVERFNTECASSLEPDDDELSRELATLTAKAREALCMNTFGPKPRESEIGKRLLKQAPAPSLARQLRVTRSKLRSLSGILVSLCICLALVAGFAALHTGEFEAAAPKPPKDWLGDQIDSALQVEPDTTFGQGALEEPAAGELKLVRGPLPDFTVLVPQKLPKNFRLESAKQLKSEATGLGFTVLCLRYTNGEVQLTLFEAAAGFPWLTEFALNSGRNSISVQNYDTAVLVVSNAFQPDALEEIAQELAPLK
jgi:hypothetical protein